MSENQTLDTKKEKDIVPKIKKREYEDVSNNRTKHMEKVLISRGVDYVNFLPSKHTFDLAQSLVRIDANIPGVTKQAVPTKKQYSVAQTLLNSPLRGKYVLGISSFPSDLRAKQFAIMLMRNAIKHQSVRKIKSDYPLWHKLTGSYKDILRDMDDNLRISMLILSGITEESTALKIEKLRDILEKYQNIPRIVVIGGVDPITFFANKLHFPMTAGIYLGPDNRVREI